MEALTRVLAIDPGNTESAFVIYDGQRPLHFGKWPNATLRRGIYAEPTLTSTHCAVETMKPRGMPTAFEEMQTQLWAGRFIEAWYERQGGEKFALQEPQQVFRHAVKMHLCGNAQARDSNIRAALIDRFGGEAQGIGGQKCQTCKGKGWRGRGRESCEQCEASGWKHPPGPLYGVSADVWQALAVAVYWWDTGRTA